VILSDFSVRRPVFATVLSLLLVILGLAALSNLPVRQYPDIDPPVVSIETTYRGASADVVETKVTQVIEDRIAGLEGIEKLTSASSEERSSIRVEFVPGRDVDEAANDIRDRVARAAGELPLETEPPEIAKVDNDTQAVMYLNLTSDRLNGLELTDYADRFLTDRFSTVPGVARVRISGERKYAMRIWVDREAMAARGLTVADVEAALRAENVELPAGRLESSQREFTLRTDTGFRTPEEFARLVLGRGSDGQLIQLGEVADVRVGAANERNVARANAVPAVSLGIEQLSKANTLDVSAGVREEMERVAGDLPEGMTLLPRRPPRDPDPSRRGARLGHGHVHGDGGAGLHDQHAHAARARARHRSGGGRCHRRPREHLPTHRGWTPAAAGGPGGLAGDRLRGRRHHPGAGRRLRAALVHPGRHRPALQRVRHHVGRRRPVLELRRADALADDGLEAAASPRW
jgi:hypothetical protein